jgi:RIO kinase 1
MSTEHNDSSYDASNDHVNDNDSAWTYTPTDQEILYLRGALGPLLEERWIVDVLYKVRVGKEATCYCCRAHPDTGFDLVAAKVYRPRQFRAMRNDWYYRIGREMATPDGSAAYKGRVLRALKKHTAFGKRVEMLSWCRHEFDLLRQLHDAGVDVPKPLAHAESAILMEFFGDSVRGAPTLHMVALEPELAKELFDRTIANIEAMVRLYLVHGDLSAHNLLFWDGRAIVIDLPQAVSADGHPGAFDLLRRDVERVCQYFAKQGVQSDPLAIAMDLWRDLTQTM